MKFDKEQLPYPHTYLVNILSSDAYIIHLLQAPVRTISNALLIWQSGYLCVISCCRLSLPAFSRRTYLGISVLGQVPPPSLPRTVRPICIGSVCSDTRHCWCNCATNITFPSRAAI